MTAPEASATPKMSRQQLLHRFWKGLNSALFITLISAVAAALLTHAFADREAEASDLAARRAELSRDLVELELRIARLTVIEGQAADRGAFTPAEMTRIGDRAKAIVSADDETVTSDPSFKDVHLVTVLGRAETAAGLNMSDKGYLLAFTDWDGADAAVLTRNIVCQIYQHVSYLKQGFQSGELPLRQEDRKSRDRDSAIYAARDSPTYCTAAEAATSR